MEIPFDIKRIYADFINFTKGDKAKSKVQKSHDWKQERKITIGGSEVATLLNMNPYKRIYDLVAEKVSLKSGEFTGNIYTRWGNVFEDITYRWIQMIFDIYDMREVDGFQTCVDGLRFSPDGIALVNLLNEEDLYELFFVMFEFKSPFKTIPNGKIPAQYVPQVQTGLSVIPGVDFGIFVNNTYRKCALAELSLTDTAYDAAFHLDPTGNPRKASKASKVCKLREASKKPAAEPVCESVYACGVILFNDARLTAQDPQKAQDPQDPPVNLGDPTNNHMIERVFEEYDTDKLYTTCPKIYINYEITKKISLVAMQNYRAIDAKNISDEVIREETLIALRESKKCCAFLPWKLLISDVILSQPEPNWLEKIAPVIRATITAMTTLHSEADKNKRVKLYNNIYNRNFEIPHDETTYADEFLDGIVV